MPQLTFPLRQDGPFLKALIGVNAPTTAGLIAAGMPVPRPILVEGLIDCGTDASAVSDAVLTQLGIPPGRKMPTQTFSGSATVTLYRVSVSISASGITGGPMFVVPDLEVMKAPQQLQGIELLIGMDVLLQCQLLIDGPARQFTLSF